jgi:bifunctional non-homologous end joining protein LigD
LTAKDSWSTVKRFAATVAEEMVASAPQAYVATMSKSKRTGRIFIDYFRNDYTATAIADYAVRASPGAPVALPIDWKELKDLESASQFTIQDVLARLKGMKKPVPAAARHTIPVG